MASLSLRTAIGISSYAVLTAGLQGLTEGQKVNYEVAEEPKGLKVVDIAIAD